MILSGKKVAKFVITIGLIFSIFMIFNAVITSTQINPLYIINTGFLTILLKICFTEKS